MGRQRTEGREADWESCSRQEKSVYKVQRGEEVGYGWYIEDGWAVPPSDALHENGPEPLAHLQGPTHPGPK